MLKLRKSNERGQMSFGWLTARHSFSFGHYFDPQHLGFGPLKVMNQDSIRAGMGFETHPHRNMEIISYIVQGGLAHKDSMGHESVIRPNEIQVMSAGRGVFHSEFATEDSDVEMLQIWIEPETKGREPSYQQKSFERKEGLQLLVSPSAEDGSVKIHRDAKLYRGLLNNADETLEFAPGRQGWVQLISGSLTVNGQKLEPGDGLALIKEKAATFSSAASSEFLFFDLKF